MRRQIREFAALLFQFIAFLVISFVLKQFALTPFTDLLGISEKSALSVRHVMTIPLVIGIYILVTGVIGRRRRVSELALENFTMEAGVGFIAGAGSMGIVLGILALGGYFRITSIGSLAVLPDIIVSVIMLALAEELIFRGILFRNLEAIVGLRIALILSGVLFGVLHISNSNVNALGIVSATMGGLLLCLYFSITGRLWLSTFFHIGWNLMQPIFGARLSGEDELIPVFMKSTLEGPIMWTGGRFGPESSLLAIGIIGLLIMWGISRMRSKNLFIV